MQNGWDEEVHIHVDSFSIAQADHNNITTLQSDISISIAPLLADENTRKHTPYTQRKAEIIIILYNSRRSWDG